MEDNIECVYCGEDQGEIHGMCHKCLSNLEKERDALAAQVRMLKKELAEERAMLDKLLSEGCIRIPVENEYDEDNEILNTMTVVVRSRDDIRQDMKEQA